MPASAARIGPSAATSRCAVKPRKGNRRWRSARIAPTPPGNSGRCRRRERRRSSLAADPRQRQRLWSSPRADRQSAWQGSFQRVDQPSARPCPGASFPQACGMPPGVRRLRSRLRPDTRTAASRRIPSLRFGGARFRIVVESLRVPGRHRVYAPRRVTTVIDAAAGITAFSRSYAA